MTTSHATQTSHWTRFAYAKEALACPRRLPEPTLCELAEFPSSSCFFLLSKQETPHLKGSANSSQKTQQAMFAMQAHVPTHLTCMQPEADKVTTYAG